MGPAIVIASFLLISGAGSARSEDGDALTVGVTGARTILAGSQMLGRSNLALGSSQPTGEKIYGETLVLPVNDGTVKITGQARMSQRMFDELKAKTSCIAEAGEAAGVPKLLRATLVFGEGCLAAPRPARSDRPGGISLHAAGLACDLTAATVNGEDGDRSFQYRKNADPVTTAFFTAFRECWGENSIGSEDTSGHHDNVLHLSVGAKRTSCGLRCKFARR